MSVLIVIRAIIFGVFIRAVDFLKLPYHRRSQQPGAQTSNLPVAQAGALDSKVCVSLGGRVCSTTTTYRVQILFDVKDLGLQDHVYSIFWDLIP